MNTAKSQRFSSYLDQPLWRRLGTHLRCLLANTLAFGLGFGGLGLGLLVLSTFAFEWTSEIYTREQAFDLNSAVLLLLVGLSTAVFALAGLLSFALPKLPRPRVQPWRCAALGAGTFILSQATAPMDNSAPLVVGGLLAAASSVLIRLRKDNALGAPDAA